MSTEAGDVARRLIRDVRSLARRFQEKYESPLESLAPLFVYPYGDSVAVLRRMLGRRFNSVGIDGSMAREEALEMLVFYACSAAYRASVFVAEDKVIMEKESVAKESELNSSGVVPLWAEDAEELVERDYYTSEEAESVLDSFTFAIMTLSELFSAVRAIGKGYKAVFLDRSLSGSYQYLLRDARTALGRGVPALAAAYSELGEEPELVKVDLELALRLGPEGYEPPSHGIHYLKLLLYKASGKEGASLKELALGSEERKKLEARLHSFVERGLLERDGARYYLADKATGFRARLSRLARFVADRLFQGSDTHPLQVSGRWLTPKEINTVSLVLMQEMYSAAVRSGILLIGIVKDTNVSDMTRSVIPFLAWRGDVSVSELPYRSDRALLTVAASKGLVETPWRTIVYDSGFAMLRFVKDKRCFFASRRYSGPDRMFARSFFQLRSSSRVSSPVFLYDRPVYPSLDAALVQELDVCEKGFAGLSKYKARMILELGVRSVIDDAILKMLEASDNPEIAEAYGHNTLLFLADKAVKLDVRLKREMLRSLVSMELAPLARREKLHWILRRFRELRAEAEKARGW